MFGTNGFSIHPHKVHYADRHSRKIVTGLKVNELLNVDRRYVRNIRAALYSVETVGEGTAKRNSKAISEVHRTSARILKAKSLGSGISAVNPTLYFELLLFGSMTASRVVRSK
jgi:hypothetical protein